MNAILDAIEENLQGIRIVFEPTLSSFSKDTKSTSDVKEITVTQFLKSYFLVNYEVKKGKIFSLTSQSNEIDCVILAPNQPPLITPKREIILAEGVYAAVEVKPDISTLTERSEFHRGLLQIKSVKDIDRKLQLLFTQADLPIHLHRIPCVIFSKDCRSAEDTVNYLIECLKNKSLQSFQLPDIVITLDNYIIFHSTNICHTLFSSWVSPISGEDVFIILNSGKHTLAFFLLIMYCFPSPVPDVTENILIKYLKQGEVKYHVIPNKNNIA